MTTKRQYGAIDIAKYISALLVVAIHTYPFLEISETFNTFFIADVCRLAVPFFFTASAFFFFKKVDRKTLDGENQLYKYLYRLGILYLVWTVIYIPYTIWNYTAAGDFSVLSILGWVRDFFLNGSYYHLWFLPALMLGTVIVYRQYLLHGLKRAFLLSGVLYLIGYLINIYALWWQQIPYVDTAYDIFIKIFTTARNGIFFAPIFITTGLSLAKLRCMNFRVSAIGFVISWILLILEVYAYSAMGLLQDLSCMFLMLVPCVYFLFSLLLNIRLPRNPQYTQLRIDSTLIYVSHILFAKVLLIILPDAHLVVYLLTLACSQMFSYLVQRFSGRFPWLKVLY